MSTLKKNAAKIRERRRDVFSRQQGREEDEARLAACDDALAALNRHREEHGC